MFEFYINWEHELASLQLCLAMLGMGMTLTPKDFSNVLAAPQSIFIILFGQLCFAPLLAVAMCHLLQLPDEITLGLLLITAMPGGSISNIFTFLARGNVPLSITATTVATAGCAVTAPMILHLLCSVSTPLTIQIPYQLLIWEISWFSLLPLSIGMMLRRFAPLLAEPLHRYFLRASLFVLAIHVTGALGSGRLDLWSYGWAIPTTLVAFAFTLMFLSVRGTMLLGYTRPDASTIGFEITMRNSFLALLIKADLFPAQSGSVGIFEQGLLYVILFYSGTALFVGIGQVIVNHLTLSKQSPLMEMRASVDF